MSTDGGLVLSWTSSLDAGGEEPTQPLLVRARAGDVSAFDELMAAHGPLVFRTARLLLGGAAGVEDAVQETFLRLFRTLRRLDPARPLEPWLYRIAVNVCRSHLRKRRLLQAFSLDAWLEAGGAEPAREERPDERRDLERALARLSVKERQAVVLTDIEGLSAAEAGRILGIEATTVRSHASRGRARLRRILEAK